MYCQENNAKSETEPPVSFLSTKCEICSENTIPMNYKNHYFCYEENFIDNLVDNCTKYDL